MQIADTMCNFSQSITERELWNINMFFHPWEHQHLFWILATWIYYTLVPRWFWMVFKIVKTKGNNSIIYSNTHMLLHRFWCRYTIAKHYIWKRNFFYKKYLEYDFFFVAIEDIVFVENSVIRIIADSMTMSMW